MKSILTFVSLFAFATAAFGQSQEAINRAASNVVPTGSQQFDGAVIATVARGIIDQNGDLVVNGLSGTFSKVVTTIAAGATPSFAPVDAKLLFKLVPAQATTIAGVTTKATIGRIYTLEITTIGTTSYTITFGANFTGQGTLETGTTSGVVYGIRFVYDGVKFLELDRLRQGVPSITVPYTVTTSTLPYADGVSVYNFTPTTSENLAIVPAGRAGAMIQLHVIGDGSAARTTTFTTNTKPTGTLATGASGATDSWATFLSDGTSWREISSTTAQTP